MSNYTPSEIAKMIKEGTWTDVQEFNVLDFLKKLQMSMFQIQKKCYK